MFPVIAQSLVSPKENNRDDRRAVAGETGTTAAPTDAEEGFRARHHRYLHVGGYSAGGTSFEITLWGKSDFMDRWFIIGWFGTAGAATVAAGTAEQFEPLEIDGIDAIYPQISANTGATADVWLAGNSTQ